MTLEQEILAIVNQIIPTIEKAFYDVFVQRHPGHGSQKPHGNRHGAGGGTEEAKRILSSRAASLGYKNIQFKQGKNGQIEVHAAGSKGGKLKKTKISIDEKGRIVSGKMMLTDTGWGPIK